ncbi:MAG TPA: hypothetical protein VHB54_01090 [Mucilaginibacter sp.]|nr:hypothetical protein [Mucilaginibacter sp.]HVW12383.1 hypothetical protein [Mucilaginibacter sp.]
MIVFFIWLMRQDKRKGMTGLVALEVIFLIGAVLTKFYLHYYIYPVFVALAIVLAIVIVWASLQKRSK